MWYVSCCRNYTFKFTPIHGQHRIFKTWIIRNLSLNSWFKNKITLTLSQSEKDKHFELLYSFLYNYSKTCSISKVNFYRIKSQSYSISTDKIYITNLQSCSISIDNIYIFIWWEVEVLHCFIKLLLKSIWWPDIKVGSLQKTHSNINLTSIHCKTLIVTKLILLTSRNCLIIRKTTPHNSLILTFSLMPGMNFTST